MRLIARYLCVLGTPLSYAKTTESVEMGELQTCVSSRNLVLDWGPDPPADRGSSEGQNSPVRCKIYTGIICYSVLARQCNYCHQLLNTTVLLGQVHLQWLCCQWYMVTVVHIYNRWSKSELRCYVDGNLVSQTEMSWLVNTSDVRHNDVASLAES